MLFGPPWALVLVLIFVQLLAPPALVIGFAVWMVYGYVVKGLLKNPFVTVVQAFFVFVAVMLRY
jgi:hypothetical protein